LAAREGTRTLVEHLAEAKDAGRVLHPPVDLALLELPELEPEGHVLVRGHVRVERVVLENHRDVTVLGRELVDHPVADANLARCDRLEPRDHAERRRLPAAGGTDKDRELAVPDAQVELVHGARAVRIDLRQLVELNLRHRRLITILGA
jgi:hypothetical protein